VNKLQPSIPKKKQEDAALENMHATEHHPTGLSMHENVLFIIAFCTSIRGQW
jgi:hypothetical protein